MNALKLSVLRAALAGLFAAGMALASTDFFVPPGPQDDPRAMVTGPDGNLWYTDSNSRKIGRITTSGVITEFPVTGGIFPNQIAAGPDGALWFTDTLADFIGRIDTSGNITEFPLTAGSNPVGIVTGPDGNLWFAENARSKIGRITVAGAITEFPTGAGTDPYRITVGPDGNFWFTNFNLSSIGRMTPAGVVTLFPIVSGGKGAGITAGRDGNLWFAESNLSNIARITPAGAVTEFPLPSTNIPADSIVAAPDGNLWFNEKFPQTPRKLGKITTGGVVTEFSLNGVLGGGGLAVGPDQMIWGTAMASENIFKVDLAGNLVSLFPLNRGSGVAYITSGPDGALWFTEQTSNKVGRITATGVFTEFNIPSSAALPQNITSGPDAALWFTENGIGQIGRVTTSGTFSEFPIAGGPGCPQGIAKGPDGNLWIADSCGAASAIEKFSTFGVETDYPLADGTFPYGIVAGPDGNVWFTELGAGQIGRITPQGMVTEFALPPNTFPAGITAGPDGNLWFTDQDLAGTVGKITTAGAITIFPAGLSGFETDITSAPDGALWIPDPNLHSPTLGIARLTAGGVLSETLSTTYPHSGPTGITTGPDHKLWFTEFNGSRIGRMSAISGTAGAIATSEGNAINSLLAVFTDGTPAALPGDFVARVDWGDGTITPGTVSGPAGGPFSVAGSHTYLEEGNFNLQVTLHDTVDNEDYTAVSIVTVSDAQLLSGTATLPSVSCMEGAQCSATLASFQDADPNGTASDYSAIVKWGDGSTSVASVVRSPAICGSEFCVQATHAYSEEGSYPTQINVSDIGGSQLQLPGVTIAVADAPLSVSGKTWSVPHGTQLSGAVASFTDGNPGALPSDFTANIDWGDGTSSLGNIAASGGSFDVSGSHTFSAPGTHTANITVTDVGGSTGSASTSIFDDSPITITGRTLRFRLGQPFTFVVASIADSDIAETGANLSATIDWGDGVASAGTLVSLGSGRFNIIGSHAYTRVGGFTVSVQVHDSAGSSVTVKDTALMWPRPFSF